MKALFYLTWVLGVALILGTLCYAFYSRTESHAVFIASGGAMFGMALICLFLPKLYEANIKQNVLETVQIQNESDKLKKTNDDLKTALKNEKREYANLLIRSNELDAEKRRLEQMRVNVGEVHDTLELTLQEVECNLTDYLRFSLGQEEKGIIFTSSTEKEYVGIYQIDYTVKLGCDLRKVVLCKNKTGGITIGGLKIECTGFRKYRDVPLLTEIRALKEGPMGGKTYTIETENPDVRHYAEYQRLQIQQRLESGINMPGLEKVAAKRAEDILRRILTPLNCPVAFIETVNTSGVPLALFLEGHNGQLEAKIYALEEERNKLMTKANSIIDVHPVQLKTTRARSFKLENNK